MKHLIKNGRLLYLMMFLCLFACNNNKPKANLEMASVNLLRGDLLLCSTESFGEVDFSQSCNYDTRATFNLVLSLLHSFEFAETEKAFVKVIDMDLECAMAYWGVSMSIFQSLWMQADCNYLEKRAKLLKLTHDFLQTAEFGKILKRVS